MHCRFENKRLYKGTQFDRLNKFAVCDSSQSLVNVIFWFLLNYNTKDDLIIHYHCLITISELNNDSFLTVSGDSDSLSYVHIRLNTLEKNQNITFTKDWLESQRANLFKLSKINFKNKNKNLHIL